MLMSFSNAASVRVRPVCTARLQSVESWLRLAPSQDFERQCSYNFRAGAPLYPLYRTDKCKAIGHWRAGAIWATELVMRTSKSCLSDFYSVLFINQQASALFNAINSNGSGFLANVMDY